MLELEFGQVLLGWMVCELCLYSAVVLPIPLNPSNSRLVKFCLARPEYDLQCSAIDLPIRLSQLN